VSLRRHKTGVKYLKEGMKKKGGDLRASVREGYYTCSQTGELKSYLTKVPKREEKKNHTRKPRIANILATWIAHKKARFTRRGMAKGLEEEVKNKNMTRATAVWGRYRDAQKKRLNCRKEPTWGGKSSSMPQS